MEAAPAVDQRIARVAQELKRWEQQFAAAHNGTKPTRLDIKQEPEIAARYSEYHRLRGSRSKSLPQQSQQHRSPKHLADSKPKAHPSTPSRRRPKSTVTPRRTHSQHASLASPTSPNDGDDTLAENAACAFVGPTPQMDGRVIGLFDILIENPTPSKNQNTREHGPRDALQPLDVNAVAATPTKCVASPNKACSNRGVSTIESSSHGAVRNSRTPQSSGKRFLLDTFVTPSKRRRLNEAATPQSSANQKHLTDSATPAFLQRKHLHLESISEDSIAEDISDKPPPLWASNFSRAAKRKPLTRSFSSMIAEIRQAEDDRLDEKLELLREMESGPVDSHQTSNTHRDLQVADSQGAHTLGPDGSSALSDDEADLKVGRGDGKVLKAWKKKGQKRQTRRVIMRPVKKTKPSATTEEQDALDGGSAHEDEDGNEPPPQPAAGGAEDVDASAVDELGDLQPPPKRSQVSTADTQQKDQGNHQGIVQKAVKKISATAHANFRMLKMRSSKGAKAAGKGRFGRGRR